MVETRGGRRFAALFFVAAFLLLLLGHWLKPVSDAALTTAAPFQSAINSVVMSVGNAVSGVVQGPRLRDENIALKRKFADILKRNLALQEQAHENQIFRRMLRVVDANPHMDLLTARVISNDPNNLADDIIINKGTRDGLRDGLTVLDQNGYFVGTILDVTGTASRVLLMLSPSSSVGAMDLETRASGVVDGQYAGRPRLDDVRTRKNLRVGDFIVTSGQINLFPRLLLLGQVIQVHHQDVNLVQYADIQPAADFSNLEMVQVVRNWLPSVPASWKAAP